MLVSVLCSQFFSLAFIFIFGIWGQNNSKLTAATSSSDRSYIFIRPEYCVRHAFDTSTSPAPSSLARSMLIHRAVLAISLSSSLRPASSPSAAAFALSYNGGGGLAASNSFVLFVQRGRYTNKNNSKIEKAYSRGFILLSSIY